MHFANNETFWDYGQEFYILKKDKWEVLKKTEEWVKLEIAYPMLIQRINHQIEFTEKNSDFICAITKQPLGRKRDMWVAFLFLKMDEGWQRIVLETTGCTNCNWQGIIANPTQPDLYLSLSKRFEIMNKSTQLKQVTCPICNGKLKRFAIWVES